ncbi:hypothetical protein F5Y01DRAFT_297018 [Xylaria sp. FL0043]|nr:hypothetical protein F5Y01DRAFT_297018 [Xylaria sp. FL0043]
MSEARVFACPFLYHNHEKHSECCKYELRRIQDVKQHLRRCHKRPPYCPVCYNTYETDKERDDHVRTQQCAARPQTELDGLSQEQRDTLHKRKNSKDTPEAHWYFIWDTCFPNSTRPDSVYLDRRISREMFLIRRYITTDGFRIIRNCLIANKAIEWTLPSNEQDLNRFQEDVVQGVVKKLVEGMDGLMTRVNTQHSLVHDNASYNREFQSPESSRVADPSDLPRLDITSGALHLETRGAEGEFEYPHAPEGHFDSMYEVIHSASVFRHQPMGNHTNDHTSDFSLVGLTDTGMDEETGF